MSYRPPRRTPRCKCRSETGCELRAIYPQPVLGCRRAAGAADKPLSPEIGTDALVHERRHSADRDDRALTPESSVLACLCSCQTRQFRTGRVIQPERGCVLRKARNLTAMISPRDFARPSVRWPACGGSFRWAVSRNLGKWNRAGTEAASDKIRSTVAGDWSSQQEPPL